MCDALKPLVLHILQIVVSHDTMFLNEVATDIVDLQSTLTGRTTSSLTHVPGGIRHMLRC